MPKKKPKMRSLSSAGKAAPVAPKAEDVEDAEAIAKIIQELSGGIEKLQIQNMKIVMGHHQAIQNGLKQLEGHVQRILSK